MSNETNPLLADTQEVGAENVEGATEQVLDLNSLAEITGRKYKSSDEAINHLKQLNSYVGDQEVAESKKLAKEYNNLLKTVADTEGVSPSKAKEVLMGKLGKSETVETADDDQLKGIFNEVSSLKHELAKERFLKSNPEAEEKYNVIEAGAKGTGQTLQEFYEASGLKEVFTTSAQARQATNNTLNAKARVSKSSTARLNEAAKTVYSNPTEENKTNLIAEFLKQ